VYLSVPCPRGFDPFVVMAEGKRSEWYIKLYEDSVLLPKG